MKGTEKIRKYGWEILVVVVLVVGMSLFISQKEGYHQDEILSLNFANARYSSWIVSTQPQGRLAKFVENEIDGETFGETVSNLFAVVMDVVENRGASKLMNYTADVYEEPVWMSNEIFLDDIAVEKGMGFSYLSVYYNIISDNHPPFYLMLLHTVCSLFPGHFAVWMGCLVNLLAEIGALILLMKSARMLAGKASSVSEKQARAFSVITGFLYVLSAGAVASVLLIRMYATLSFLCILYFWMILKKWEEKGFERKNVPLILVTAIGFWTQYFFLFYCMTLALVLLILLWRAGRKREALGFARSMGIAAVVGVVGFPFSIADVFSSGRGVEALSNLASGLSGYGTRLLAFLEILGNRTFPLWVWAVLLVGCIVTLFAKRLGRVREEAILLILPPIGYFFLAARMSPYLVDRYLMPMFPLFLLIGTVVALYLVMAWKGALGEKVGRIVTGLVCGVLLLAQVLGLVTYDGEYLYRGYSEQLALSEEYAQDACICVYTGVTYYENIPEFTNYSETLLLTEGELLNRMDRESILAKEELVLLIKDGVEASDVLEAFEKEYGFETEALATNAAPHGDSIYLLRASNT